MAITGYTQTRSGQQTVVTATSDLGAGVAFYWFVDGAYVGRTVSGVYPVSLPADDEVRIEALDSIDPNFDPFAAGPAGYPARRTIRWCRPVGADVAKYRVEQNKNLAGWVELVTVAHDDGSWSYGVLTQRLDDLTDYQWRVVPIDAAGNAGTPLVVGSERVVRTPDAPDFAVAGNIYATFTLAA